MAAGEYPVGLDEGSIKLLITRGNITSIPREAPQEKEKKNLQMQLEKVKKKEKEEYNQERI